jgi:hypothetical protein
MRVLLKGINTYGYVGGNPISATDPLGLWSITVGYFPGVGGQVTVCQNPNGSGFATFQFGFGIGGGFSFDPGGKQPGYRPCQCASWTGSYGLYAESGVQLGLPKFGVKAEAGRTVNSCSGDAYGGVSGKAAIKDGFGVKASTSAGGQISFGGGGSATGGCTC